MADLSDKISKLLAKAERAATEEERDAYDKMAERLILKYGIEEAEIQAARDGKANNPDPMEYKIITITGTYNRAELQLAHSIATGLRTVRTMESIKGTSECKLYIFGYRSDIGAFETLWRSLKRQATREANAWAKNDQLFKLLRPHEKVREKVTFIDGFGTKVWKRLREIAEELESETTGSELVLVNKSSRADEFARSLFAVGKSSRRGMTEGSYGARQAGFVAGDKAQLQGEVR